MTTTLAQSGLSASPENRLPGWVKRLHALIYSPPKKGKTVFAHHMPNTRTLDFDDGMQAVEWAIKSGLLKKTMEEIAYETILPPRNEKTGTPILDLAAKQVEEWIKEEDIPPEKWDKIYPQFWDTLIIDSATTLTEASIIKGLKENESLKLSKSWGRFKGRGKVRPMRQQDWGAAAYLFMDFISTCRSIGKNVIVLAHEYHTYREDDEGNNTLVSIDPLVIGQLRQRFAGSFDECWYMRTTGTRVAPKYEIQTTPDSLRNLGSRLGCFDSLEKKFDFYAMKKKVAKFYGVPEDLLWRAAHGSEEVAEAMKEDMEEEGADV